MIIGRKFWPLEVGDYRPSSNPPTGFIASKNGTDTITGIGASTISAMNTITAANLAIVGAGFKADNLVSSIGASSVTLTSAVPGVTPNANFVFYDRRFPTAGQDQAIAAVLCLDSTAFEFIDVSGNAVAFGAGVLVPGAVYYFQVGQVTTATAGDYMGYAPY
jgi:hypothetical protein